MKKILISLMLLATVLTYGETSGFVKISFEPGAENDEKYDSADKKLKVISETKVDLGMFLDANKDNMVYGSGKFVIHEAKDNKLYGYVGYIGDNKINENVSVAINGLYRNDRPYTSTYFDRKKYKDVNPRVYVSEFLKANSKTEEEVYDTGYIFKDNDNVLLSAIVYGKVDNTKYKVGSVYNSEDFKINTHRLESEVKTETNFDKVDLFTKLTHKLGHFEKYDILPERKYVDLTQNNDNLKQGGRLLGEVRVFSDKIVKNLEFSNKVKFDLGTIAPEIINNSTKHGFLVGTDNELKYKVNDNIDVYSILNYNAFALSNKITENNETKEMGMVTHIPKIEFGLNYSKNSLKINAEIENRLTLDQRFTKVNPDDKLVKVNDYFRVKADLGYKFKDYYTFRAKFRDVFLTEDFRSFYYKELDEYSRDLESRILRNNAVIVGIGFDMNRKVNKYTFKNSVDLAYKFHAFEFDPNRTKYYSEALKEPLSHEIFAYTENSMKLDLNKNFDLELFLNIYGTIVFDHEYRNGKFTGKINKKDYNYSSIETGLKLNRHNDVINFKNNILFRLTPFTLNLDENHYNEFTFENKSSLDYRFNDIVELNAGFDVQYNLNTLPMRHLYKKVVKNQGYLDDLKLIDYYPDDYLSIGVIDGMTYWDYIFDLIKYYSGVKHNTIIEPRLGVTVKALDGKMLIKPSVSYYVHFSENTYQKKEINKHNVKGNLTVEYKW